MRDGIKGHEDWIRKQDIIDWYTKGFNFPKNEEHFSVNDILGALDELPSRQTLEVEVKLNTEECEKLAEAILEDYEYEGKSIREWIEEITKK